MVVGALEPERSLSHTPLFQVMFALQNMPQRDVELSGLKVERFGIENPTAKFDLSLFVSERDGGLNCSLEYNTDLFERATVERMLGHYRNLLTGVTKDVTQPIWELPLLGDEERRQVVVDWNATRRIIPPIAACTSCSSSRWSARRKRWR